jgi:hypothetical protein
VVAEEVEAEVEQRCGRGGAVDLEVALLEMPAARTHEQPRDLVVQLVVLLARVQRDRAVERVREVALPLDAVLPGRRVGVLEVRHEHPRARVERVDHHLPVDRPGDLNPTVGDLVGERRDPPVALADGHGLGEEVGQLTAGEPGEALRAAHEKLRPSVAKLALEVGQELDRLRRQDVACSHAGVSSTIDPRSGSIVLVVALAGLRARARSDLGPRENRRPLRRRGGRGRLRLHGLLTDQHTAAAHAALLSAWNCCSSVEPVRARVDETPPETASMILSKYPAPTSRWWRVAV